jgi:ATP/maltotriose-dependent transcriptional regulator MalT
LSWGFHCVHNDRHEALEARREVEEIAARTGEPLGRAVADWVSGATDFYDGQHVRALERLGPVVDYFRKDGTQNQAAQGVTASLHFLAWLVHGWALAISGYVTQALTSLSDAVVYAEKNGGPFGVTQALSHQIAATLVVGPHLGKIRELANKELVLSQQHQLPQTLYLAQHCLGWIAATTGDEQGIEEMLAAIEGSQKMGTLVISANQLILLADSLCRFGRDDEALDTVNEALRLCTRGLGRYYEPLAHQVKGELLWKQGDRVAGEATLRSALRVAENQGAKIFELRAATALARSLCEVGRASEGRDRLAQVCRWFEGQPDEGYLGHAKALLERLSES